MTPVTRRRGRLPARVYWFRRLLVLGLAAALVFGVGRFLDGSPDPGVPTAQQASAPGSLLPSTGAGSTAAASPSAQAQPTPLRPRRTRTPLPEPTGPCRDDDVKVVPAVEDAPAGSDVALTLRLRTVASPACTWEVSADSLVVRLTSGSDRIWTSQDCPAAITRQQVVLRQRPATLVQVLWSGRRSDRECSRTTQWAEPGYYHVTAAALGAEPADQQFALRAPAPVTITPTPRPSKKRQHRTQQKPAAGRG